MNPSRERWHWSNTELEGEQTHKRARCTSALCRADRSIVTWTIRRGSSGWQTAADGAKHSASGFSKVFGFLGSLCRKGSRCQKMWTNKSPAYNLHPVIICIVHPKNEQLQIRVWSEGDEIEVAKGICLQPFWTQVLESPSTNNLQPSLGIKHQIPSSNPSVIFWP